MEFRICKNKYGYYAVMRKYNTYLFGKWKVGKGNWLYVRDLRKKPDRHDELPILVFDEKEYAELYIEQQRENIERNHDSWEYDSEKIYTIN
jgi:hypothetical protein